MKFGVPLLEMLFALVLIAVMQQWWMLQSNASNIAVGNIPVICKSDQTGPENGRLQHIENLLTMYIPIMLITAFVSGCGFGYSGGKLWNGWDKKKFVCSDTRYESRNAAMRIDDVSTEPNVAETPGLAFIGKATSIEKTRARALVAEMKKMTFTSGKHDGKTFAEVWLVDRNYFGWMRQNSDKVDIGFAAFAVYGELMLSLAD